MFLRLVAFAVFALIPTTARAAGPVCALLDPEKDPRAALLEAKLLTDPSATWVERANVEAILKEQKLQTLFSPQGVGDRVKLGKLLKADLLILVRPVKDAKEPVLEVIVSETAGGLRLSIRGVPVTKDADADVVALLAAVRDGMKKHGEKIKEVVAVPPFVSNDLEFAFDHLKGAFAKLAEVEALGRPGVVVVELAEADAVGKELALAAPGTKLDRPLPIYLLGEYRHEGKGKDRTVAIKLRAERGGKPVGKPASSTLKPDESPASVRTWAAEMLDAMLKDDKPRPPADPKAEAKQLVERAMIFKRLGNWVEALALIEASFLIDPEQRDRRAEAIVLAMPLLRSLWRYPHPEVAQLPRIRGLHRRGIEHLESLFRGMDIREFRDSKRMDLSVGFFAAMKSIALSPASPSEVVLAEKEMDEERREFLMSMVPNFAAAGGVEHAHFLVSAIMGLPAAKRYEIVERILTDLQDLPGGKERAELYGGDVVRRCAIRGPMTGKLDGAEIPEALAFLGRLEASKNSDWRAAAATLRKSLADELLDFKNQPVPGRDQTLFKPIALETQTGSRPDRVLDFYSTGSKLDLLWSSSSLYVMKEKGRVRPVWPSKDESGIEFHSARFDGKYFWVSLTRFRKSPLLLVVDPETERVWDVSGTEGLPRGPDDVWATLHSACIGIAPLSPGRACAAGSFGRTWIAILTFDAERGRATAKVIHEAREAQDRNDPKQAGRTTVEFQPTYMFTLRGRSAPTEPERIRVLIGRSGFHTGGRPLVIDPEAASVELLSEPLIGDVPPPSDIYFGGTSDAVYRLEVDPTRVGRNRVVRIGWPAFAKDVVVENLPSGRGFVLVHEKQIHIAMAIAVPAKVGSGVTPAWEWWTADLDGKRLRRVATGLPPVRSIAASAHYGVVAIVNHPSPPTLCTVNIDQATLTGIAPLTSARKHPDEVKGVRSEKSETETTIRLINKSSQSIRVYWLDFQGKRKLYGELAAGKAFEQKTYVTHAWLITDLDDNGWYVIRPEAKSPKIEIEAPKSK